MAKKKTKAAGGRKAPRSYWNEEREAKLKELYPVASWDELHRAFVGATRSAIVSRAVKLRLKRPTKAQLKQRLIEQGKVPGKPMATAKPEPPTDEQVADYLTHGRSVKEVASHFKITVEEAAQQLEKGLKDYDLVPGPKNIREEPTYVAVPSFGKVRRRSRAWEWRQEPNGQPYGAVVFPKGYRHKKIRIVPLDGIHYGSPDHDDERFRSILQKIENETNTFCYLNGDVIAPVEGGTKKEREDATIDRSHELSQLLQPIAHKIMFAQRGCLEARTWKSQRFDPLRAFCGRLDIPYFTEPVYLDIWFGDNLFTLFTIHGYSMADLKGSKINALRRPAQVQEFTHFVIMGHIGDALFNDPLIVTRHPIEGSLVMKEEFQIVLGSFTKYLGTDKARRGKLPPSNEVIVLNLYADGDYHVKTVHGGES
jgi:hypothetical protein